MTADTTRPAGEYDDTALPERLQELGWQYRRDGHDVLYWAPEAWVEIDERGDVVEVEGDIGAEDLHAIMAHYLAHGRTTEGK